MATFSDPYQSLSDRIYQQQLESFRRQKLAAQLAAEMEGLRAQTATSTRYYDAFVQGEYITVPAGPTVEDQIEELKEEIGTMIKNFVKAEVRKRNLSLLRQIKADLKRQGDKEGMALIDQYRAKVKEA